MSESKPTHGENPRSLSGQLPYEVDTWRVEIDEHLVTARQPFDELLFWVGGQQFVVRPTLDRAAHPRAVATVAALLCKLIKNYRAMLLLCEHGLGHEAMVMLRNVLETAAALRWLAAAPDLQVAALRLQAHEQLCVRRMYHEHEMLDHARDTESVLAAIATELGSDYNPKALLHHYYEQTDFRELCKDLGWTMHYLHIYRLASSAAHVSDLTDHLLLTDNANEHLLPVGPGARGVQETLQAATVLLSQMMAAVDSELQCFRPAESNDR